MRSLSKRRPRLPAIAGLALALAAAGLAGCGTDPRVSTRANVLLVTLDTTRADRLGCYGHRGADTENLDRLAGEGVIFDRAASHSPLTLPSHCSMMTGLYPPAHGVRGNGRYVLSESHRTLAEILQDAGYQTAAIVAAFVLERRFGLAQGFDRYDDDPRGMEDPGLGFRRRDAPSVTRAALEAAAGLDRRRPYFLWVHYFDPHAPYEPPAQLLEGGRHPYDGEITAMDRGIGRLLDGLESQGLLEDTWIVVAGDHGEGLGTPHGELTHGCFLYEETIRIPLIITPTGDLHVVPRRAPHLARQIDVLPTVLDLLGLEPDRRPVQGRSLAPILSGSAPAEAGQPVRSYSEAMDNWHTYGWAPLYELREGRYKFIEAPTPELYDLKADPREQQNLAPGEPDRIARFRELLHELLADTAPSEGAALGVEDVARLRALGYAVPEGRDAAPPPPGELEGLADPKDRIGLINGIAQALALVERGEIAAAVRELERLHEQDPTNIEILSLLASYRLDLGDLKGSEAAVRELIELRPDRPSYRYRLASVHSRVATAALERSDAGEGRARITEAIRILEGVTAVERLDARPFHLLGTLYSRVGRVEPAERALRRALELDLTRHDTAYQLAFLLYRTGRLDEAESLLTRAIDLAACAPSARRQYLEILAQLHQERGRPAEARETLDHLRSEFPDQSLSPGLRASPDPRAPGR